MPILVKCPGCGKEVYYANDYCPDCKTPLKEENMPTDKCPECGVFIIVGMSTCPKCGCNLIPVENIKEALAEEKGRPKTVFGTALTSCPVCGREVSEKAFFCVGCGHPMRTSFGERIYYLLKLASYTEKIYTLLKWIVIVSVVSSIVFGTWYGCQLAKYDKEQQRFYRRY